MAASSISRLPTPAPQPARPFSRYSNLSESYVYPHTDIHPLTVHDTNKPRFNTTTRPTPPPSQQSIFQPDTPLQPASYWPPYIVDLCLPRVSTPAAVHVDPTYNAPLSVALATASLDRFPLSTLSVNALHRSRQAVEEDEEAGRRRKDEEQRVREARQAARRRVVEQERRRREEADRRIQQLPLHVRQLVYQRWEQTATADETLLQTTEPATNDEKAASNNTDNNPAQQPAAAAAVEADPQRTMHVHDLDDATLPNQTIIAAQCSNDVPAVGLQHHLNSSHSGSRLLMSRDEQRLFQLRVQQLARHKERLELHRITALRKQEAEQKKQAQQQRRQQQQQTALLLQQQQQQQQQHNDTLPAIQPLRPSHRPTTRRLPSSVPATPRSRGQPPMLSWLYDELQRRLRVLGDVSVVPLCGCSRGGGTGGVGKGLVHVGECEWMGRDEAYAMKLLERVEELERVRAEQLHEEEEQRKREEAELTDERQRNAALAGKRKQNVRVVQR